MRNIGKYPRSLAFSCFFKVFFSYVLKEYQYWSCRIILFKFLSLYCLQLG